MNEELKIIITAATQGLQQGMQEAKESVESVGSETETQGGIMDGILSTLSGSWDAMSAVAVAACATIVGAIGD